MGQKDCNNQRTKMSAVRQCVQLWQGSYTHEVSKLWLLLGRPCIMTPVDMPMGKKNFTGSNLKRVGGRGDQERQINDTKRQKQRGGEKWEGRRTERREMTSLVQEWASISYTTQAVSIKHIQATLNGFCRFYTQACAQTHVHMQQYN